jgi:iron complex outermembrane receptor protein
VYRADYTDLQFRSGTVGTSSFVGNAGEASITGVESEFQLVATKDLFLFLNYAYQNGEYDSLMIGETDYSGNSLALTPKHSLSLGISHLVPVGSFGDLIFRGDYQYKSEAFLSPEHIPGAVQKIDGLLNASVSMEFLDGKAQLTVFCKNITDETFITRVSSLGVFLGQVDFSQPKPFADVLAGSFNEPRRWGISMSYQF